MGFNVYTLRTEQEMKSGSSEVPPEARAQTVLLLMIVHTQFMATGHSHPQLLCAMLVPAAASALILWNTPVS